MSSLFSTIVRKLKAEYLQFDHTLHSALLSRLSKLSRTPLPNNDTLLRYHDLLLFILAHPQNRKIESLARKELKRISNYLKNGNNALKFKFENSGLPYTPIIYSFSHDFLCWLSQHKECLLELAQNTEYPLSEILALTLPATEKSLATAGYTNEEFLEILGIDSSKRLYFYLDQFNTLGDLPQVKDYLFEKLDLQVRIKPKSHLFSRAYNKIPISKTFLIDQVEKTNDHSFLINKKLPKPKEISAAEKGAIIHCIKNAMALTSRETDPITYLEPDSLRVFALERGVSVALYSMTEDRQLPIESYVGYMLFRNGLPVSYGGSWVFGYLANFGINIFDWFRGGESGYTLCQLLRVYHQVFNIAKFEVEPYQYGLDNPDGIKSGAFWFYYRYGFRPTDRIVKNLADKEWRKIKSKKNYKSPRSTLEKFTESNIILDMGTVNHPSLPILTKKITKMIAKKYHGKRSEATSQSFYKLVGGRKDATFNGNLSVLQDFALLIEAIGSYPNHKHLPTLRKLASLKAKNPYVYQSQLRKWLDLIYNQSNL